MSELVDYLHYSATALLFGFWTLSISLSILGTLVIFFRYKKKKPPCSSKVHPSLAPPVSVLRPLKGVDCNLLENLESSFRQKYPVFELIFSVADPADPAVKVVKKLCEQYPKVDARLIIGSKEVGVNPKVNNLIKGYETAKYDIIWILDSNIFIEEECMARSVDELCKPSVGLVHHVPCGTRPISFGSNLEMAFLNTSHARLYSAINALGIASCVVGKSNLFRKSQLNVGGGLFSFGKFMSEDNIIGQAIWDQKLKHQITCDLAYQPLGSLTVTDYIKRRARWTRIRKYAVPVATIAEIFAESITAGLSGAYAAKTLFGISGFNFFSVHMLCWLIADTFIYFSLYQSASLWNYPGFFLSWLVREVSALHVYLYAIAGSTVEWRGQLYNLNRDGTVVLSKSKPIGTIDDVVQQLDPKKWFSSTNILDDKDKVQ